MTAPKWETVTADQVRVGDLIEVTRESAGGAMRVWTGPVTVIDDTRRALLGANLWADLRMPVQTIRRKVRQPMPEPAAPAVVRHSGQIWVRQEMCDDAASGAYWWPLSLGDGNRASEWRTWSQVLAIDPTTDPVIVDLGEGE